MRKWMAAFRQIEMVKQRYKILSEGVYLITAKETKDYDCISPFLVAMPTWNEQCGEMIYEIEVI